MGMDKVQKAIVSLLNGEGVFYASLLMQMNRVSGKDLPEFALAAVSVNNGRIMLHIDPERLEKFTTEQVAKIMEHECLHLVLEHISRLGARHPYTWNIATDLAVNSLIHSMDLGLLPGREPFTDFPKGKTAEFYYGMLQDKIKKMSMTLNPDGSVTVKDEKTGKSVTYKPTGDHKGWASSDGDSLSTEVVKQAVEEAAKQAKAAGKLPGNIEQIINELLNKERLNWKQLLRQYVGNVVKADSKRTWKRENKRFGIDQKGKSKARILDIAVAIDTSGSVSNEEFQEFMGEIYGIQRSYKSSIEIIECDAEIQKTYKLKQHGKVDTKLKGRGGTDFRPVFKYFENKRRFPGLLIFFTDLEGPFPSPAPRGRTLWIRTSDGYADKVPFGKLIIIPKKGRGE